MKNTLPHLQLIALEPLEPRIAPAILVNASTVQFTDIDNDLVTIRFSGKVLDGNDQAFLDQVFGTNFIDNDLSTPQQLKSLDLTNPVFQGVSLSIKAKAAGGDGFVHVGEILAAGNDLNKVTIQGDLGRIVSGSNVDGVALKFLQVDSFGAFGTNTGAANLNSVFTGDVKTLLVGQNIEGANLSLVGGHLGKMVVGGDFNGGDTFGAGVLSADSIGSLTIKGDLAGGIGQGSGSISVVGDVKSISIGGNVLGGSATNTAEIAVGGNLGKMTVGGDWEGSSGVSSARLFVGGNLSTLKIGGDLAGGAADYAGSLNIVGNAGKVLIGGDMIAGGAVNSAFVHVQGNLATFTLGGSILGNLGSGNSGMLLVDGNVKSASVGGDIVGGVSSGDGRIYISGDLGKLTVGQNLIGGDGILSGSIKVVGNAGTILINGNLQGGSGLASGSIGVDGNLGFASVKGSVLGSTGAGSGTVVAIGEIGKVIIGNDVVGGSGTNSGRIGTDAKIGTLVIGGNLEATSAKSLSLIQGGDSIKSLTIKGDVTGINPGQMVTIGALGTNSLPAFGKVMINGDVKFASFLGGYNSFGNPTNADAQIGKVTVGGDWTASNLVSGVFNLVPPNFGNNNDSVISKGDPGILSKIASIVVKGTVDGTVGGADSFGFVAQQIGKISVGGSKAFVPELGFTPLGTTGDFKIHILPA